MFYGVGAGDELVHLLPTLRHIPDMGTNTMAMMQENAMQLS